MAEEKVEAPVRVWIDLRENGLDNAQWMDATDWKPADDGENESDWALYVRVGTPSTNRQRAERAARKLDEEYYLDYNPKTEAITRDVVLRAADIIAAEFEK